ncbi:hypothetical protein I302_105931 [Kwoniella bestiolae CBS 10118]|uniref:Putative tyrosine-protein phosphatase OCA1 n=1 Tax=Kwoniella bestiolae CBS 10118 TaxID=1296100 RepID=A0A1B9G2I9_9TREE|nr:hypothetical protein I302_05055 [Kwoniella bestiolae CBS 10118]OCF25242.1 hypothetical protein I302_05055 [Kwoniella bestiolae CBS 10118]
MLTPPYHFSISATSHQPNKDGISSSEILYRGSIPAPRNKSFIRRLNLKTIVVLRKKQLKDDDPLIVWCKKRGVQVKWIKAEEMGEEKLGMGKNEVLEVLKIILDTKSYPLYIADIDGISHTTLITACLRKLQGWHMDSIINEICRFEPEYQDLPLLPFIQSFLSQTSPESFVLPQPPYPSFLWPSPGAVGQGGAGGSNVPSSSTKTRDRASSTVPPTTPQGGLPFPHPLSTRKHPSMKLTFPILPPPPPNPSASAQGAGQMMTPPLGASPMVGLSRVNSRRDKVPQQSSISEEKEGMIGQAVNSISGDTSSQDDGRKAPVEGDVGKAGLGRTVSFHSISERQSQQTQSQIQKQGQPPSIPIPVSSTQSSPLKLSREQTHTTSTEASSDQYASTEEDLQEESRLPLSDYQDDDDEYYEDENEEDEDEEDEEDEDDEDDEGNEPTSQYISALDLAGFG